MQENFKKALEFVLKWEGGRSEHPKDPGGLTIYGISQKSYPKEVAQMDALWKQGKKSEALEIAKKIYKANYWDKLNCDALPYPLDIIAFDTAVNMGVGTALSFLKQSKDYRDFLLLRIERYKNLAQTNKNLTIFLIGWLNRVLDLYKTISKEGNINGNSTKRTS